LSRHIAKLDRAPVMASTHLEHPLAQRSKIALEELSAYPVLLQDKETTYRQLFDIACNVESIEIPPVMTSRYVAALYRFAEMVPNGRVPAMDYRRSDADFAGVAARVSTVTSAQRLHARHVVCSICMYRNNMASLLLAMRTGSRSLNRR
jgi:hypothetical protein